MDAFERQLKERLPLACATLELFDFAFDDALLAAVYDGHRGRCYTDTLTFPDRATRNRSPGGSVRCSRDRGTRWRTRRRPTRSRGRRSPRLARCPAATHRCSDCWTGA